MISPENIKRAKEVASGLIRIAEKASICVLVFLAIFVFNTLINIDRRMTKLETCRRWGTGIEETDVPGTVTITFPEDLTKRLRRGPFLYSVDVADPIGNNRHTCEEGTVLVEYAANAPIPDVPYRTDV